MNLQEIKNLQTYYSYFNKNNILTIFVDSNNLTNFKLLGIFTEHILSTCHNKLKYLNLLDNKPIQFKNTYLLDTISNNKNTIYIYHIGNRLYEDTSKCINTYYTCNPDINNCCQDDQDLKCVSGCGIDPTWFGCYPYGKCKMPPPKPTPPTPLIPTPPTCKTYSGTNKNTCINYSASSEVFYLISNINTQLNSIKTNKCIWDNSFNFKVCCDKNDASNGICYPYCRDPKQLNTNRCPVQSDASMIEAGFPYSFEMTSNSLCKSHTTYNACEGLYMCSGNQLGDPDIICNPCKWNSNVNKCYDTQCVGPRTQSGNYDTNCANGALATAKAWITGCDSYIPEGSGGRSHDKRVPNGVYPYSKTYCQKRCPVAIGLAHTESLYSPTAISPDWGKTGTITINCPQPPMSDGSCFDYGGGYGLWQLDGRNDHVQKNFIEQIEGSGYFNGWSSGFFTPARRNLFFNKGKAYKFLTPTKQAHWILDQTTGDFDSKVKLPGADWSRLMTCAGGPDSPEVWNSKDNWNPVTPYNITITTGIDVCTKAMKEIKNKIVKPDFFDYSHCSCNKSTNSTGCHVSTVNPTPYYN